MINLERDNSDNRTIREKILSKAASLITGQRQQEYGTPEENFQHIADSWTVHLRKILKHDAKISARQVAEMMVLLKMARTLNSPTEDSYVDAGGYSGIAGELAAREEQLRKDTEIAPAIVINTENKLIPEEVAEKIAHNCGPWCK